MSKAAKAEDFLSKMGMLDEVDEPAPPPVAVAPVVKVAPTAPKPKPQQARAPVEAAPKASRTSKAPPSRVKLKHIGAYLEREDCEKIALLRARLDLDNSQLIALAINNLYKTESAKRKFGDA